MTQNNNNICEVLKHLKKFKDQTYVIKFSGEVLSSKETMESLTDDLVSLSAAINPVIVHGAGNLISSTMERLGKSPEFVGGLRVTDESTLTIVTGVLHYANSQIVSKINRKGGRAVGFSGVSDNLFVAKQTNPELGLVGDIEDVNSDLISLFTQNGHIPVIYPIGMDRKGELLNINADTAAGALGSALGAEKLVILSSAEGILKDINDENSLISEMTLEQAQQALTNGFISGGMIPKLKSCVYALEGGVEKAHIVGCKEHELLHEIFTEEGIGTMITK